MKTYKQFVNQNNSLKSVLTATEYNKVKRCASGDEPIPDALWDKLFNFMVSDMPYGTAKARTGDPDEWIRQNLPNYIEEAEAFIMVEKMSAYDYGHAFYKKKGMAAPSRDKEYLAFYQATEKQPKEDKIANFPHLPSAAYNSAWMSGWNAADKESDS